MFVDDYVSKQLKKSYNLQFIVIGDSNVGKTTLLQNFVNRDKKEDDHNTSSTFVVDTLFSSINIGDDKVKLILIDTAGTERYNAINLCKSLYTSANGIIIVYDVTNRDSFINVKIKWLSRLKNVFDNLENYKMIIVANKIDLVDKDEKCRQVTIEEGQSLTNEYGLPYIMMSALYKDTIELPFKHLIQNIFENQKDQLDQELGMNPPIIKLKKYDYDKHEFIEPNNDVEKKCEC